MAEGTDYKDYGTGYDSTYWSGQISFAGLGNGTDFTEIVKSTVAMESYKVKRYDQERQIKELQKKAVESVATAMGELKTSYRRMDTVEEFMAKKVETSDEDSVSVTTTSGSFTGSQNIVVNQIAQNHIFTMDKGMQKTDEVTSTAGSFEYSYGTPPESFAVSVPAGTTLEEFTNLINAHPDSRSKVRASMIFDGEAYHLEVRGMDQGKKNQLAITNSSLTNLPIEEKSYSSNVTNEAVLVPKGGADDTKYTFSYSKTTYAYDATAPAGMKKITNNVSETIDVKPGETLEDLAKKINDATGGDVTAKIKKGTVAGSYSLELGTANGVAITTPPAITGTDVNGAYKTALEATTTTEKKAISSDVASIADKILDTGKTGKFKITVGATEHEIDVAGDMTIKDLNTAIKAAVGGTAKSTIVPDPDDIPTPTGPFSLNIVSTATPAEDISMSDGIYDPTTGANIGNIGFKTIGKESSGDITKTATFLGAAGITTSPSRFHFSHNGVDKYVDINATHTIEDVRDLINGKISPDSVEVKNSGGENNYLDFGLSVTPTVEDPANPGTFISADSFGEMTFGKSGTNETQKAQNSEFRVNGYPDPGWLERDTNVITDAVDGLSFTLKKKTDLEGTNITVTDDIDKMEENVMSFVEQFNTVVSLLRSATNIQLEEDENGEAIDVKIKSSILSGMSTIKGMDSVLKNITSSGATGFRPYDMDSNTGDFFSTLAQVGITYDSQKDSETFGQLIVDDPNNTNLVALQKQGVTLKDSLKKNAESVAMLFSASQTGETNTPELSFSSCLDSTEPGRYDVKYEIDSLGNVLADSITIGGHPAKLSGDGKSIIGQAGTPLAGLDLRLNIAPGSAAGVRSHELYLKEGKIPELVDQIDIYTRGHEEGGTLAILENSIDESIEDLEDKIYKEQKRLESLEKRLKMQFASLDALMQEYNGINAQLTGSLPQ